MVYKCRCIKQNYKKDSFVILAWIPIEKVSEDNEEISLSQYGTFSTKGEHAFIDVGKEYELELVEISKNEKYGSTYDIVSIPSLEKFNFENLSYEDSFEILMDCTSSSTIAKNILNAYPNFISKILTEGKESINLNLIKGVGESYLNSYERQLNEKYKYYSITQTLKKYEIQVNDCKTLINMYGDEKSIVKAVEENPYEVFIDILNYSFEKADKKILSARSELSNSKIRCEYFVLSVLKQSELEGSTYVNANDLYSYIINEYPSMRILQPYIVDCIKKSSLFYFDEKTLRVSVASTYYGECKIKDFVYERLKNGKKLDIDWTKYIEVDGFTMSTKQQSVLECFCNNAFMIVQGYSGSGKTASTKCLINMCEKEGLSYCLLSSTGSASIRLKEATNKLTSTVHRKCLRDKVINSDVVLVDEATMLDLPTYVLLLDTIINSDVRMILVGDPAQLCSVGVGRVFSDLANSGKVPCITLDEIFRYKTNGGLFVATNVRQGRKFFNDETMVKRDGNRYTIGSNYEFIETDDIVENVKAEYNKLIKKGVKPNEILCLTPMNIGECGTIALNSILQTEVNPLKNGNENFVSKTVGGKEIIFHNNDCIINTKNDYSVLTLDGFKELEESDGLLSSEDVETTEIFNGQRGIIRDSDEKNLITQFGEDMTVFNDEKLDHLSLGYCITIHKSQGSEAKYVINIISKSHKRMLSRNLLYVADTRAKEKTIDIGSISAFNDALLINEDDLRDTWLRDLLKEVNY